MPIEFLDLLDDDGWEPAPLDSDRNGHRWSDGSPLAAAPVDVAATFEGAVWHATGIDPTFGLTGVHLRPALVVPRRHHSEDVLRIVFGGSVTVRHPRDDKEGKDGDDGGDGDERETHEVRVGPGQFFVVEAGTPYVLAAGPEGVTFLESWPQKAEGVETCWYPDPAWVSG